MPGAPGDRDTGAWALPLITTLVLLLLAPVALGLAGLSVMATDSCGPDNCSAALMGTLDAIFVTVTVGGVLSLVSLVVCWALPWRLGQRVRRRWAAAVAVAPHLLVVLMVFALPAG
ncbi:hypothetical protein GUY60_07870 [Streptomyces sp. YC537]|uniref:Uncharacterized protein n=1 Tax=Streptomyces boluensis TaxID=1775135 RepID=A0A964ULN8_9ACTN|nr:hypothetical protein [Streptomyces boluensis]